MKNFSAYIALGDSMSIDCYPALDLEQPTDTPLGAAALLYSNNAKFWPAFDGKDLHTALPDMRFANLCVDGAVTWDLLDSPYAQFVKPFQDKPVLITLTIGGNDALQMIGIDPSEVDRVTTEVSDILERFRRVVGTISKSFSDATLVLTTIYDPSDGKGVMPRYGDFKDKLPFLRYINDEIRSCAKANNHLLADAHAHFLGHGMTAAPADRWYWSESPIEPSARGASELRSLWLQTLGIA